MKRFTAFFLTLCLCLSLTACGGQPHEPTEPSDWVISTQYITDFLGTYITSKDFRSMQDAYVQDVSGQQFETKARGPYLQWAMEYYLENSDGPKYHLLAMGLLADVSVDANLTDCFTMVYDMDQNQYYNNISYDFTSQNDVISGILFADNIEGHIRENGIFYSEYEFYQALTETQIGEVNDALGLKPLEKNEEGEVEKVTEPVVALDKEALIQRTTDAAIQYFNSNHFGIIAEDASLIQISNAMEYGNPDFQGYHTHLLLLELSGVNTDNHTPVLVVDIASGEVYHRSAEQDMPTSFDSMESVYAMCSMSYETFLLGDADDIWDREKETCNVFDAETIGRINEKLSAFCAETKDQKQKDVQENAASLNAEQQQILDAVLDFQNSQQYRAISSNPGQIQIAKIVEYEAENLEGFSVHVRMVQVDDVDTDMYGASVATVLLDMNTGKAYTEQDLDLNNWGDFDSVEDIFAMLMCSENIWDEDNAMIWSEEESISQLPQSDLDMINHVLKS